MNMQSQDEYATRSESGMFMLTKNATINVTHILVYQYQYLGRC